MKKNICILLSMTLLLLTLSGCGKNSVNTDTSDKDSQTSVSGTNTPVEIEEADFSKNDEDMFSKRDYESGYSEDESVLIRLEGASATANSDSVKISGTTVTITEEATYILSGTLDDGMIIVNADDKAKLQLVFNGVNINSKNSAALYVLSADKVFVTLADGTENVLSNGDGFEAIADNNIDGAIFSKQDLTFNGEGSLTVTSPEGHGIVCKDDLVFTGGTYMLNSASHGMDANDSVRIAKASITIEAGKDGIHAENTDDAALGFVYVSSGTMDIEAEGDGISAGAYLQVQDGTIDILAGGGYENGTSKKSDYYGGFKGNGKPGRPNDNMMPENRSEKMSMPEERGENMPMPEERAQVMTEAEDDSTSMKGLKAVSGIQISDGTITIDSADDSIHADTSVIINGGTFKLASGDDGVHAENTLTITTCNMNISNSYEGLEAQKLYVKGGTIDLKSTDDGLNASGGTDNSGMTGGRDGKFGGGMHSTGNGVIEISGGKLTICASGDGMDSNGSLTISDGDIYIANPVDGDTSIIDADIDPVILGGTFISTGVTTKMAQTFGASSTQGVITCTPGTQSAGSEIIVKDSNGNTLISYKAEYTCEIVIISSKDIVKGETYTLAAGSKTENVKAE